MHRISQLVGLNLSTGRSTSLILGTDNVAKARSIFMTFRELPSDGTTKQRKAMCDRRLR
jgi:hypothetical protein